MTVGNSDKYPTGDYGDQVFYEMRCICKASQVGTICLAMANQQEMKETFGLIQPVELKRPLSEYTETISLEKTKSLSQKSLPVPEDPLESSFVEPSPEIIPSHPPSEELQITAPPEVQETETLPLPKIRSKSSTETPSPPKQNNRNEKKIKTKKKKKKKKSRSSSTSSSEESCVRRPPCCYPTACMMPPPWWMYNLEPPIFVCQPPVMLSDGRVCDTGGGCTPFYPAVTPIPQVMERPQFSERPALRSIFPPCGPCDPCVPTGMHQYFLPKR